MKKLERLAKRLGIDITQREINSIGGQVIGKKRKKIHGQWVTVKILKPHDIREPENSRNPKRDKYGSVRRKIG